MLFDTKAIRVSIQKAVSEHIGRRWEVVAATDLARLASHPCAILSDGSYEVFAKYSDTANSVDQFETEVAGLRLLTERGGIRTPEFVAIASAPSGSILILEAVQAVPRGPKQWRQIGRMLAQLHRANGSYFGLERHCYFGPLHQDNTPLGNWPEFLAQRRLLPGLRLAIDSGNMPLDLALRIEQLITRLPTLCGPEVAPVLIHGDAQQNNFISTSYGAVAVDPAAYYGHPEMDLAFVDYFQPVPDDLFAGYQETTAIDRGFWERRELWRVWGYLGWAAVGYTAGFSALTRAVDRYL